MMTPTDCAVFTKAASFGLCLGLNHRYEWYVNALRALAHGPYTEMSDRSKEIDSAFLEFEKTLASCLEEEQEYKDLTIVEYVKRVNDFYDAARSAT